MKRRSKEQSRRRPVAPRIEPSGRQVEADILTSPFPERWHRAHPF